MSEAYGWAHPSRRPYRFGVLVVVCFMIYGSYFAYDSVGAIEDYIMESMSIGQKDIGLMYSMYSWGAIFTLLLSGFLIDRLGTRRSSLLFAGTVTAGAAIVSIATEVRLIHVGRFVFGAGSEALIVAQSAILARWFKGKELAFAFGAAITIGRLGTLFSFNTEALLAELMGPRGALWIATALCGLSMLATGIYAWMDTRAERVLHLDDESSERIRWGEVFQFNKPYWYLTFLCLCFYSAIFPFTALSTDFFVDKWGIARVAESSGSFLARVFNNFLHMFSTAGGISSIIIFASMILAPFAGQLVDKIGRRASLMLIGSLLMIPSYLLLGLTHIYPAYPMIFLGAAFVLVPAAMWPSIPLIVRSERVGTAFGLMTAIQNIGLALFPLFNGLLRDWTKSYTSSMLMFASLGVIGFWLAFLLKKADSKEGGALEKEKVTK